MAGMRRAVAARLGPRGRAVVRAAVDRVAAPVGSVAGARVPDRLVALTYDDGPDPVGTPRVLAALASAGVTATFFVLAYRAEKHPDLVREVLAAGHEVGLHGIDHTRLTSLPLASAVARVMEGRDRLEAVTGVRPTLFRPPYGAQSVRLYRAVRRAGLDPVVWGPTVSDWVDGPAPEVAARGLERLAPGSVMLLHDGFEVPPGDATPPPTFDRGAVTTSLLGMLADRGYRATSVAGLLAAGPVRRTAWFRS